ncbi:DNA cytosine methyltransferase [Pseudoroseomonas wenyumeiae]
MRAISLFSGIGGLDFGFEAAGFETRVALELDRHCCRAIRRNRPSWEVIEDDVNVVSPSDVLARAGLASGEADVLIGGPPCQPFSKSSYWVRGDTLRLDDPRAATLHGYLEMLRGTLPRAFLLENVGGLAYEDKNEGLRYILDGVRRLNAEAGTNYRVAWRVINTAEYGVPQIRERTFLVASATAASSSSRNRRTARRRKGVRPICSPRLPGSRSAPHGTPSVTCPNRRATSAKRSKWAALGATCCRRSPKARTTSGTPRGKAAFLSSAGGRATGPSC